MVKGIVFFEEYFEYMDDMTPEQYYEFMGLIRNLRFKGIDTKPEEITDKDVRMAWRSVRPSIVKSRGNAKDYENRKSRQEETKKPDLERWLEAIRDGKSPGEYQLFEGYWNRFFKDREQAKKYVQDYLKQYKKNISL